MKILILLRPKSVLNFSGDTDFHLHLKKRGRIRLYMSTVGHPFLIVNKEQFCKTVSEHNMLFGQSTFIRREGFWK